MSLPKEPLLQPEPWPTRAQSEAVKIVDPLYTFMARAEMFSREALLTAQENLLTNTPMDKIEEDFVAAADKYLNQLISEYDSE